MGNVNYNRLKLNLNLSLQRLKLLVAKKTENTKKLAKEISGFVEKDEYARARIKTEYVIREDYTIEAMELLQSYLDLLLARFALFESIKTMDAGFEECISSIIWATRYLKAECAELDIVTDELICKFGKSYGDDCISGKMEKINKQLKNKLSIQVPSKLLVEKYLYEISHSFNVPFRPDEEIARQDPEFFYRFDHSDPTQKPPSYDSIHHSNNDSKQHRPPNISFIGFNPSLLPK